jgi:hypothetical protein
VDATQLRQLLLGEMLFLSQHADFFAEQIQGAGHA